ncbi:MAG: hypothetical protein AAFR67_00055 [Chloroflexota bacterium]
MAWTQPKTWSNEPLVASDLNTHLRDNMEALKEPPSANYELDETSDYTTTSTTFVDVDSTNLSLTLDTNGGDVMVHFHATVGMSSYVLFDVLVDGVRTGGDDGIVAQGANDTTITFTRLITGLPAGSHTFTLQWKVHTGTGTLYAGAGTFITDLHPQFWAREVS